MKFRMSQQKANNKIKTAINTMIKNISVIAIFVSLGVIALLYLGPEINLATNLVFRLAVPSVVLAISITVIYELWLKNGRRSAYEEEDYQTLLKEYTKKSDGLHYPTLQKFLDYERNRRYIVEEDRLTRIIERETSVLNKLNCNPDKNIKDQIYIKWLTGKLSRLIKIRSSINVFIPYEKSEEFDYLRYNLQDVIYKEYSPNDSRKHLTKARTKKYTFVFTFSIVGFNLLSIGGAMGDPWVALIMTVLAALSLMYSVVMGFSTGYHNIKVISTGVYNTANSFIDQAVAYCKRINEDLYYKGTTEFKELPIEDTLPILDGSEFFEEDEQLEKNLFTKAEQEVTKLDKQGI